MHNAFFLALLLLVLYGICRILAPFGGALLTAFCLAVTFYPLHQKLGRKLPHLNDSLHALLSVFCIVFFIVLPVSLLVWTLVAESESLGNLLKSWGTMVEAWKKGHVIDQWPLARHVRWWMHRTLGIGPAEFQENFFGHATQMLQSISKLGAQAAQNTLTFLFHLFLMLFTLFFFLRDGKAFEGQIVAHVPLKTADTHDLVDKVHDTIVGVMRGWLLTSVVQGLCATIGYWIAGVNGAVIFGVLTALVGLIPVVGTFGVWVPIAIYLLASGPVWKGVFIFLWGAFVVVGFIDTIVRPYLVGQRAEMPLLFLFFALLGGVEVFGAKGIVLGPLLIAVAPILFGIYRERYMHASHG